MKKLKEVRGITLIALVITIIVLLILAGVSIAALSGQNGILTKAKEASQKTIEAQKKEEIALMQTEAAINTKATTFTGKLNGIDTTVPIPAECTVSTRDGENSLDNGLVIIDKNGNEWVWIPCNTTNEYAPADDSWASSGYKDESKKWTDPQVTQEIKNSVSNNGGFYIARYEAGIPENMIEAYANIDGAVYKYRTEKDVSNYIAVSKPNVQAWNYITQPNAKIVAEKMLNNSSVRSYLVDSYAWNAVCRKIDSKLGTSDTQKTITNSTKCGNYYNNTTTEYEKINTLFAVHNRATWTAAQQYRKGNVIGAPKNSGGNMLELSSGASEDFKAYNVYDIAGNMWEWTTEESSDYRVLRGGGFSDHGSDDPVVCRNGNHSTSVYYVDIGFRASLYVK